MLRLWLFAAPLAMLGLAMFFAVLAIGEENWGLLAAMVVLGLVALGLFVAQGWAMRQLEEKERLRQRRS